MESLVVSVRTCGARAHTHHSKMHASTYDIHIRMLSRAHTRTHAHSPSQADITVALCPGVPEASSLVSQAAAASRVRRASGDKFAEMLLVADTTMHHHYEDSLRQYILTVANVVSTQRGGGGGDGGYRGCVSVGD